MPEPLIVQLVLGDEQVTVIAQRVAEIIDHRARRRTRSEYVSVQETAELLRCARARIDNLLTQGRLTRIKDGGRTLIERAEVEAYLRGEPTGPIAANLASRVVTRR